MSRKFVYVCLPAKTVDLVHESDTEHYDSCMLVDELRHSRTTLYFVSGKNRFIPVGVSVWSCESLVRRVNELTSDLLKNIQSIAKFPDEDDENCVNAVRAFSEVLAQVWGTKDDIYICYK